jgi:hypothetical protein
LLNCNRFGQFFFDNVPQLATKAIKAFERPNLEQQAAITGKPLVELERERRYIYSDAKTYDRPQSSRPPNNNQNNQNSKRKLDDLFRWLRKML